MSIRTKTREMKTLEVPGPGTYDRSDMLIKNKAVTFKIGNSTREDLVSKSQKELPGPGNYEDGKTFGKGGVSASIRGKRSDMKSLDVPGPGSYEFSRNAIKEKVFTYKIGSS